MVIDTTFQSSFYYFPSIGTYRHYPFLISQKEKIIGDANIYPNEIIGKYPNNAKELDVESWKDVGSNANLEQLKVYFNTHSISQVDLSLIYHRLKDASLSVSLFDIVGMIPTRDSFGGWTVQSSDNYFQDVIGAGDISSSSKFTINHSLGY